ncbi:MAG: arsenate reductase ArsC [Phycisphaerales bacterium]|nr:arsenate reductase ArsC [Phycisphaerales bacterium]
MPDPFRVLFICTANACRSQMAEALLRHMDPARFHAASAGAHPVGFIHPLAIDTMNALGVSTAGQYSKSWSVYENEPVDLVITLCDAAAAEPCPRWGGPAVTVHWPTDDPVAQPGADADRRDFALQTAHRLRDRIRRLIELDVSALPRHELTRRLDAIGLC